MKNHKEILRQKVLKNGWKEVAERIGGFDNLYKHAFNNDYNEFLKLYSKLDVVQSQERPDWTLYRFEKGKNMMIYSKKNETVYVNHYIIWSFFEDGIDLKHSEIQSIMRKWLGEVYNLSGVTPINKVIYLNLKVG